MDPRKVIFPELLKQCNPTQLQKGVSFFIIICIIKIFGSADACLYFPNKKILPESAIARLLGVFFSDVSVVVAPLLPSVVRRVFLDLVWISDLVR